METANHKKIIWLASYPKSGNTWFRAFLANLLHLGDKPADINELEGGPIASSRSLFDEATGLSSSDLTPAEIENLRPFVYQYIARNSAEIIFHKIHDAYTLTSDGVALVPAEATRCAIYFVRNPLDVAVSFAHHANTDFRSMTRNMNNPEYAFCSKTSRLHMQLRQRLLTWSDHVMSWTRQTEFPVMVIKYEDMKLHPVDTFSRAIQFCEFSFGKMQIEKAVKKSSFAELKKQEEEKGFRERSPESASFFRKGMIGSWKEELPEELAEKIMQDHREMMLELGYL